MVRRSNMPKVKAHMTPCGRWASAQWPTKWVGQVSPGDLVEDFPSPLLMGIRMVVPMLFFIFFLVLGGSNIIHFGKEESISSNLQMCVLGLLTLPSECIAICRPEYWPLYHL